MALTDLIPHAPHVGLYVAPHIPERKLDNALKDYAKTFSRDEVLVLFDATLMGSAKDGAVFARDRMIFQNNDLQSVNEVRYEDIVQVDAKRKLIGGRRVLITVNRGHATFEIEMDFSGKPQAADFVLRFLREAMLHPPFDEKSAQAEDVPRNTLRAADTAVVTDVDAVSRTLADLRNGGFLSDADYAAMLRVLGD